MSIGIVSKMESREELISKGLGFLGRSKLRRKVYEKINGKSSSIEIAKELKKSQNQVLNEIKKLSSFEMIEEKKKVGNASIYRKTPKYASLNLHKRKTAPRPQKQTETSKTKPTKRSKELLLRRKLLNFAGKYPEVFYDRLEKEINVAYNIPSLPNAVLNLSRKLIENLLYNVLEKKYPHKKSLWWNNSPPRPLMFSDLLKNMIDNRLEFSADEQELIEKFNMLVNPFIKTANQTTHRIMEYLDNMGQINKFKIPEIVQVMIKLYNKIN